MEALKCQIIFFLSELDLILFIFTTVKSPFAL